MMTYRLRYFFDAGSGVCLWSANDAARDKYGYPIDHLKLPISENLKRMLNHLIAWYDTSIDWDDPAASSPWTMEERQQFRKQSTEALHLLNRALENFEMLDERKL